jgi:Arylsulfotransferase (ASST)
VVTAEGRWWELPPGPGVASAAGSAALTPEQQEQVKQLESIGYLGGVEKQERSGVTIHDPDAAYDGANFFSSGHAGEAFLMDMDGNVLHRWAKSVPEIWPGFDPEDRVGATWFRRVRLLDNGDILAVYEGVGIVKLDKDSNVIWARQNDAHHDLDVQPNGDIVMLTRAVRMIPEVNASVPTLEDFVTVLDADGNEKRKVSVWECFRNSPFRAMISGERLGWPGDVFHTNTVHVLDGTLEDRLPAFRRGAVLVSLEVQGVLAVLDLDGRTVRWADKGLPTGQHDPRILPNGHLLVFDNRRDSEESAVTERDPDSHEAAWEFRGTEAAPFHSRTCGAANRLPNGNTLITESDGGRALEVTPGGKVVWEFYNPARAGDDDQYIATLSEVERVDWADVHRWLK